MTVGDVAQTRDNGVPNINAPGATLVVASNTIVRLQSRGFALDRGLVATGRGMSVFGRATLRSRRFQSTGQNSM